MYFMLVQKSRFMTIFRQEVTHFGSVSKGHISERKCCECFCQCNNLFSDHKVKARLHLTSQEASFFPVARLYNDSQDWMQLIEWTYKKPLLHSCSIPSKTKKHDRDNRKWQKTHLPVTGSKIIEWQRTLRKSVCASVYSKLTSVPFPVFNHGLHFT